MADSFRLQFYQQQQIPVAAPMTGKIEK